MAVGCREACRVLLSRVAETGGASAPPIGTVDCSSRKHDCLNTGHHDRHWTPPAGAGGIPDIPPNSVKLVVEAAPGLRVWAPCGL
eukprot:scaffold184049_cov34-Attheya_sp.AAC.1